jgi:hypothetical protein
MPPDSRATDLADGPGPPPEMDSRFSDAGAVPTPWTETRGRLRDAQTYLLTSVRADGRPHATTIAGVWLDGAIHFATGIGEQKAKNLAANPFCLVTVAAGHDFDGTDVVLEGEAVRVTDPDRLQRIADAFPPKYGSVFIYEVAEGGFSIQESPDLVLAFQVRPMKVLAFAKGEPFSQTSYRF